MLRGQRLKNDMVVLLVNDSAHSLVDLKIFSEPPGNHHLPFYGDITVSVLDVGFIIDKLCLLKTVSQL